MTSNIRRARRWTIAVLAAILLSGTAITLASTAPISQTGGGAGYDPLGTDEQARVVQALQQAGALPPAAAAAASAAAATVPAAPEQEILLVERHAEDKATYAQGRWQRRADVYVYRYADDTLIHQIYNLDTNQIDRVETVQRVQLALTAAETQRAAAIALADPVLRPQLDAEFQRITGQVLTAPEQLQIKAMAFHADSAPGHDLGAAADCGLRRCAQLLLAAGDNIVLPLIPIVNLSSGAVAQTMPFDGSTR